MRSVISASAAVLLAPVAQANLVINGSFEQPLGSEWKRSGNVVKTASGITITASDGQSCMHFNAGQSLPTGVVSQDLVTTVGSVYKLEFDFGKFLTGRGTAALLVEVTGATNAVLFTTTVSDSTGATGAGLWNSFSFEFVTDSTLVTLTFRDASSGTNAFDAALDNVRVNLVPTPASAALFAVAGLTAGRRRR